MNYYEPLKRKNAHKEGLWHMTKRRDGYVWPIGYCALNNCEHTSAIEASDCYRKYCKETQAGRMAGMPDDSEPGTVLNIMASW